MLLAHAVVLFIGLVHQAEDSQRRQFDTFRFPSADIAILQAQFSAEHEYWLRLQIAWEGERSVRWDEQLRETVRARHCWDILVQAQLSSPYWQLEYWNELRELLGERDYAAGQMPPPAPFHRFPR